MANPIGSMVLSPSLVRARAGVIATEHGLIGIAAGLLLAITLVGLIHGEASALPLFAPGLWVIVGLGGGGMVISVASRVLEIGEAPRQAPRLGLWWRPAMASAAAFLVPSIVAIVLLDDEAQSFATARAWQVAGTPGALLALATLSIRAQTAARIRSHRVVAELAQPIAHAVLAGGSTALLVGLLTGQMSAHTTYRLGAAVCASAALTVASTGLCVRRVRAELHRMRAQGARFPVAEQAYRLAAGATMIGLLVPAVVIVADLLAARLTGMVLAAAALAVSSHALRYALTASSLALPAPGASNRRGPVANVPPSSAVAPWPD